MTTVIEYLEQHEEEITCTQCGQCCTGCNIQVDTECGIHPTRTEPHPDVPIEVLDDRFLPGQHPKIDGLQTEDGMYARFHMCHLSEVHLVTRAGLVCPPVVDVMNQLTNGGAENLKVRECHDEGPRFEGGGEWMKNCPRPTDFWALMDTSIEI